MYAKELYFAKFHTMRKHRPINKSKIWSWNWYDCAGNRSKSLSTCSPFKDIGLTFLFHFFKSYFFFAAAAAATLEKWRASSMAAGSDRAAAASIMVAKRPKSPDQPSIPSNRGVRADMPMTPMDAHPFT